MALEGRAALLWMSAVLRGVLNITDGCHRLVLLSGCPDDGFIFDPTRDNRTPLVGISASFSRVEPGHTSNSNR